MRLPLITGMLLMFIGVSALNAQESISDKLGLPKVDVEPSFKGGEKAWIKFLEKNLIYPPEALKNNIEGKVFLSFYVDKEGVITRISEIRSPDPLLTKEAIRVLKKSPKWKPARLNKKNVDRFTAIQIVFKLS